MATFRIFEDEENFRGKDKGTISAHGRNLQQSKRVVLGVLQGNVTNKNDAKDEKLKTKIISTNNEPFNIYEKKTEDAGFKVYENKLKQETSVALRETKESKQDKALVLDAEEEIPGEVDSPPINVVQPFRPASKNDDFVDNQFTDKLTSYGNVAKIDTRTKRDISKSSRDNQYFDVEEYRADIYNYLRISETLHRPKPGYMKKQPDITYSMRSILVDWLVEVAEEYRLQNETLYLAVSYIDRFLSFMSVVRAKLQLVGTAAMFIAAKYEEIYPPEVGEFVYITDDTYSKKQVLRMEHLILRILSFDLTTPTPVTFLQYYCTNNNLSEKVRNLAMYFCELSMLEADPYLQYVPSHLAASAIALAQHTCKEEVWPHELELSVGYDLSDLKDCIIHLTKTYRSAPNLPQQAIQEKYRSNKYCHVSLLMPQNSDIFECEYGSDSP